MTAKKEIVLVVAAHPDDEILGCGASMALHAKNGDEVYVLIMAEGFAAREKTPSPKVKAEIKKLHQSAVKANAILGVKKVHFSSLPDNRMDSIDLLDVVQVVEDFIAQIKPTIIYTHIFEDLNIDHKIVNQAVVTATRPVPGQPVKSLFFFEVPSATEWFFGKHAFNPTWFTDVSSTIALKMKALKIYEPEMREFPHARSYEAVKALSVWRGACAGMKAAEAFIVGRHLERRS